MSHTPGPWKAHNVGAHWNNKAIDNWVIYYGVDHEQIVDHVYKEADAQLIAAAPDLLAHIMAYPGPNSPNLADWDEQRKALIAKAEGR